MKLVRNISTLFLNCLLLITTSTSCATIINGTRQNIRIESQPANAYVWVDQNFVGNTPLIVAMSRKDNHVVHIEVDGFLPYEAMFSKELSGWVFGNIIFGGFIGLAVDAISGGIYRLTPDQINVQMLSNHSPYSKNSSDSSIFIVLESDPSWEKIGNLVAAH